MRYIKSYKDATEVTQIAELQPMEMVNVTSEFEEETKKAWIASIHIAVGLIKEIVPSLEDSEQARERYRRELTPLIFNKRALPYSYFINQALDIKIEKSLKEVVKKTSKGDILRHCPICGLIMAKNYRLHDLGMIWWCKKGHFSVRAKAKGEEYIRCKECNDETFEQHNPKDKTKPFWCFKCRKWKNRQGAD